MKEFLLSLVGTYIRPNLKRISSLIVAKFEPVVQVRSCERRILSLVAVGLCCHHPHLRQQRYHLSIPNRVLMHLSHVFALGVGPNPTLGLWPSSLERVLSLIEVGAPPPRREQHVMLGETLPNSSP